MSIEDYLPKTEKKSVRGTVRRDTLANVLIKLALLNQSKLQRLSRFLDNLTKE